MLSASSSSPTTPAPRQDAFLAVLLVLLVGLNLRPILAAIGPLLDGIQAATGLEGSGAGALTTLPIAAMGSAPWAVPACRPGSVSAVASPWACCCWPWPMPCAGRSRAAWG
ncbi:hypothetical protein [Pseudomonas sp. Marseille-Q7302]